MASGGTVAGAGEAALRALAKLDQVMPPRLRAEVRAVRGATGTLAGSGVEIDAEVLVTLARACRDAVRVGFRYAGRDGRERERAVKPVRMVTAGRRWYLMAYDVGRDGWCTLSVGGDDLNWLAAHLARLPFEAQVLDPPEPREAAAIMARRLAALGSEHAGSAG